MNERAERFKGKSVEELLAALHGPEPGSIVHEQIKAAIGVRIAEMQREAAHNAVQWARITALATAGATVIALVALLVAAL